VDDMTVWYTAARKMSWPTKAVLAAALLAALLVAAVPVALFAGVILMLLGHVVGGLALFGASILVAAAAVVIAVLGGARQLRKLISRQRDVVSEQRDVVSEQHHRVVHLGRGDYRYE
jgi:membrane protein implicated in regulation of membrane protease activity